MVRGRALTFPDSICLVLGNNGTLDMHSLVVRLASCSRPEIAPEPTGHGLPLSKCEAYNRVYDQRSRSS